MTSAELIADARNAVDRLLDQSRHDAWVHLREGYGEMSRALESDDKARKLEELASELAERRNETERLGAEERERRDVGTSAAMSGGGCRRHAERACSSPRWATSG